MVNDLWYETKLRANGEISSVLPKETVQDPDWGQGTNILWKHTIWQELKVCLFFFFLLNQDHITNKNRVSEVTAILLSLKRPSRLINLYCYVYTVLPSFLFYIESYQLLSLIWVYFVLNRGKPGQFILSTTELPLPTIIKY